MALGPLAANNTGTVPPYRVQYQRAICHVIKLAFPLHSSHGPRAGWARSQGRSIMLPSRPASCFHAATPECNLGPSPFWQVAPIHSPPRLCPNKTRLMRVALRSVRTLQKDCTKYLSEPTPFILGIITPLVSPMSPEERSGCQPLGSPGGGTTGY